MTNNSEFGLNKMFNSTFIFRSNAVWSVVNEFFFMKRINRYSTKWNAKSKWL